MVLDEKLINKYVIQIYTTLIYNNIKLWWNLNSWSEYLNISHNFSFRWVVGMRPTKSLRNSCGCRNFMLRGILMTLTPTPILIQRMAQCMTGTMTRRPGFLKYDFFFLFCGFIIVRSGVEIQCLRLKSVHISVFFVSWADQNHIYIAWANKNLFLLMLRNLIDFLDNRRLPRSLPGQLRLHTGRRFRFKQCCSEQQRASQTRFKQKAPRKAESWRFHSDLQCRPAWGSIQGSQAEGGEEEGRDRYCNKDNQMRDNERHIVENFTSIVFCVLPQTGWFSIDEDKNTNVYVSGLLWISLTVCSLFPHKLLILSPFYCFVFPHLFPQACLLISARRSLLS